jgi:hypothetical protein
MKQVQNLENKFGFKKLQEMNNHIGQFLGFTPEIEWCVGLDDGTTCYSPKDTGYFPAQYEQKKECIRYLSEQTQKYPNGWVIQKGYKPIELKWYPFFYQDWNYLIKAISKLKDKKKSIRIDLNIEVTFMRVYLACA